MSSSSSPPLSIPVEMHPSMYLSLSKDSPSTSTPSTSSSSSSSWCCGCGCCCGDGARRNRSEEQDSSPVLEGCLHLPSRRSETESCRSAIVVLAHPHSWFGGNMDFPLLLELARSLTQAGFLVLRFNFRGVGGSHGSSSWTGTVERSDVETACEFARFMSQETREVVLESIRSARIHAPAGLFSSINDYTAIDEDIERRLPLRIDGVYFVGYSFGASVGCSRVSQLDFVKAYVAISPPNGYLSWFLLGHHARLFDCEKPKLFLNGTRDNWTSEKAFNSLVSSLSQPVRAISIPGADHFFFSEEHRVCREVVPWLSALESMDTSIRRSQDGKSALSVDTVRQESDKAALNDEKKSKKLIR